ncbi:MepB family protein [Streptomyces sp. NPDC014734]|uniref:MepB family protein n=1 Tax=Streptomyces sp. NPDC014734 TaxID=3364886 RepID=UPI0036F69BF1
MTTSCGPAATTGPGLRAGQHHPVPWSSGEPLHTELLTAKELVYDPCGFVCTRPEPEAESAEYVAHVFSVDGSTVRFRVAKTTPTKAGQFVTVWKRSADGPIQPFGSEDPVDLFVISSRDADGRFGQFVFPRDVLCEQGIVARNGSGGKRAFRVYPPWVATTSRQAARTQEWQTDYFLHVSPATDGDGGDANGGDGGRADAGATVDPVRCRALYHP